MRILSVILMVFLFAVCGRMAYSQEETKPDGAPSPQEQSQALNSTVDKSTIVYVSDFELYVVKGKDEKDVPIITPAPATEPDTKKQDGAAEQASKLVNLLVSALVKDLEKAGYTVQRMRPGEARPDKGIEISGVFAEPDEENRLRRVEFSEGSNVGEMSLFVGASNLARPVQALYSFADGKSGEHKAGAVITVTSYAPVAKFEMQKDATEKALEDTASKIVVDLTLLLNANIAAVTH
jgi:Domain of unknown function (DUF4410)